MMMMMIALLYRVGEFRLVHLGSIWPTRVTSPVHILCRVKVVGVVPQAGTPEPMGQGGNCPLPFLAEGKGQRCPF